MSPIIGNILKAKKPMIPKQPSAGLISQVDYDDDTDCTQSQLEPLKDPEQDSEELSEDAEVEVITIDSFESPSLLFSPRQAQKRNSTQTFALPKNSKKSKIDNAPPKKKKNEDSLEALVNTCTSIGQNIKNAMVETDANINRADHHFLLSMLESMQCLPDSTKLRLKANFLVQVADEVDRMGNKINCD